MGHRTCYFTVRAPASGGPALPGSSGSNGTGRLPGHFFLAWPCERRKLDRWGGHQAFHHLERAPVWQEAQFHGVDHHERTCNDLGARRNRGLTDIPDRIRSCTEYSLYTIVDERIVETQDLHEQLRTETGAGVVINVYRDGVVFAIIES